jgi:uroporphyrinogen decarboxylase
MPDLIDCGWDAKHSFEDEIMPIWDFKAQFGQEISPLGGFDVHTLCTLTEDQVRNHTRKIIQLCGNGYWAIGTGNSVADYVPIPNFLAMLAESRRA